MKLNQSELTNTALDLLRNPDSFNWYLIPLLAGVIYVYLSEWKKGNRKTVEAAFALYLFTWITDTVNSLILHFSGHALWIVPKGTAFLLMIGIGAELSLMFALSGILFLKSLPKKHSWVMIPFWAVLFAGFEMLLSQTGAMHWVYPWWGNFPVIFTAYCCYFGYPFVLNRIPAFWRRVVLGATALAVLCCILIFGVWLGWV